MSDSQAISKAPDPRTLNWLPYLCLLLPVLGAVRTLSQPEFWLHLAQGQAGILREETFSWALSGSRYVNVHWLYDLVTGILYASGGAGFVILAHTAATGIGFALLIAAAKRFGRAEALALAVLLSAWLMLPKLDARPLVAALPWMGLMWLGLERTRKPLFMWILVGTAQLFWTQISPTFFFGPILCGLYAWQDKSRPETESDFFHSSSSLWKATALAAVISLLNPYGPLLHVWIVSHLHHPFLQISVTGISPLSDSLGAGSFKRLLYAAMVIGGLGLLTYRERLPFAPAAITVATGLVTVMSVGRLNFGLLAAMGFPFFVLSFDSIIRYAEGLLGGRRSLLGPVLAILCGIVLLASSVPILRGGFYQSIGSASRFGLGLNTGMVSSSVVDWLDQQGVWPERLVHLPVDGGYIAHRKKPVFLDQRIAAYPREELQQLNRALLTGTQENWSAFEQSHQPDAVLLNLTVNGAQNTARLLLAKTDWKLAWFDGTSALIVRPVGANRALLQSRDPSSRGLTHLEEAREEITGQLSRSGVLDLPLQVLGGGRFYATLNRWQEANALLELAAAALPGEASTWSLLGISRHRINELDRAALALEKSLQVERDQLMTWMWLARIYSEQGEKEQSSSAYQEAAALNEEAAARIAQNWNLDV